MQLFSIAIFVVSFPATTNALQIGPLLSTCVNACRLGCEEIRSVQSKRTADGGGMNVELKVESDAKSALTEADLAAQAAIVGSLRREWGDKLLIVGEEDGDADVAERLASMTFPSLDRSMFDEEFGETADIDIDDVTLFIDPLDATNEFVQGRLANCQSLVGIAINGVAVAGVAGIPFPAGDLSTESSLIYGMSDVGTGILGEPLTRGPFPLDQYIDGVKYPRPQFASGDSTDPVLVAAREAVVKRFGGSNVRYGGAGNKILAAALGEVAASIQPKFGGPWDICAPQAIIEGMGGRITDLFGNEIDLYRKDSPPGCNKRGYVATPSSSVAKHEILIAALNAQPAIQKYKDEVMNV